MLEILRETFKNSLCKLLNCKLKLTDADEKDEQGEIILSVMKAKLITMV